MNKKTIDITTSCGAFITKNSLTDTYLNDIRKYPTLTPEEEITLIEDYQLNGNIEARNKVITYNQRFVYAVAKRYGKNTDIMDLVDECSLGLLEAIEVFKPDRGFRFLSFGVWYMRYYITQYLNLTSTTVRKVNNMRNFSIVNNIKNKFFLENGRYPEIEEIKDIIATQYQIDIRDNAMIHDIATISLDSTSSDDDFTFADSAEFTNKTASSNEYVSTMENEYNTQLVNQALVFLNNREREIIKYIFGLCEYEGKSHSLQEAGEKFGYTSERIRQLRNSGLEHLKPILKQIIKKQAV